MKEVEDMLPMWMLKKVRLNQYSLQIIKPVSVNIDYDDKFDVFISDDLVVIVNRKVAVNYYKHDPVEILIK